MRKECGKVRFQFCNLTASIHMFVLCCCFVCWVRQAILIKLFPYCCWHFFGLFLQLVYFFFFGVCVLMPHYKFMCFVVASFVKCFKKSIYNMLCLNWVNLISNRHLMRIVIVVYDLWGICFVDLWNENVWKIVRIWLNYYMHFKEN